MALQDVLVGAAHAAGADLDQRGLLRNVRPRHLADHRRRAGTVEGCDADLGIGHWRFLFFLSPLPLAGEGGEPQRCEPGEGQTKGALSRPRVTRAPSPASGRGDEAKSYCPQAANASLKARSPGVALLDRQDGAAAVVVDDRNVEPGALLQELKIALHVGFDRREADQEEARRHLHGEPGERRAARLLGLLHQDAGHVGDAAEREVGRQVERDLDGVARRQRLVGVAAERQRHRDAALGDLEIGAHGEFGRRARARRNRLGAPDRRTDVALALPVGRVLLVEHDALRDGRDGACALLRSLLLLRRVGRRGRLADTIRRSSAQFATRPSAPASPGRAPR